MCWGRGTHTLASRVVCVRNAQLLLLGCDTSEGPRALPPTQRVLTRAHSGFSSHVPAKHEEHQTLRLSPKGRSSSIRWPFSPLPKTIGNTLRVAASRPYGRARCQVQPLGWNQPPCPSCPVLPRPDGLRAEHGRTRQVRRTFKLVACNKHPRVSSGKQYHECRIWL